MSGNPTVGGEHGSSALPLLRAEGIAAGYGEQTVLRDVTLSLRDSSVSAVLGPNGAGKSTLLRALSGLIPTRAGRIRLGDSDLTRKSPHERLREGVCLIPEGRGIFRSLSVWDNLRMFQPPWRRESNVEAAIAMFPVLGNRRWQLAGSLSGGEQQMLALARVFLSEPKIALFDEVSMGLAPIVLDVVFGALRDFAGMGIAIVLVEQYVERALTLATEVHVLQKGRLVFSGSRTAFKSEDIVSRYLGG